MQDNELINPDWDADESFYEDDMDLDNDWSDFSDRGEAIFSESRCITKIFSSEKEAKDFIKEVKEENSDWEIDYRDIIKISPTKWEASIELFKAVYAEDSSTVH